MRLAIVPRKPERFEEVANLIKQDGFELIRYSEIKNSGKLRIENEELRNKRVILGDTMGDLRKFYSLSDGDFCGQVVSADGRLGYDGGGGIGQMHNFRPARL